MEPARVAHLANIVTIVVGALVLWHVVKRKRR